MRQVVLDGVLKVSRGVTEAAVVSSLMVGPAGYGASLGKVMEITQHYKTNLSFDSCMFKRIARMQMDRERELFQAYNHNHGALSCG